MSCHQDACAIQDANRGQCALSLSPAMVSHTPELILAQYTPLDDGIIEPLDSMEPG